MTFASWLSKQKGRDDVIGDLAKDTARVSDAPASDSKTKWHSYLTSKRAAREAHEALDEAHAEWSAQK